MGLNPVVARVSPHYWEEPCISGSKGSGAVFFSGCALRCVYCQNYEISCKNKGREVTPAQLAQYYKNLESAGVHNINLVNPTHFTDAIIQSLKIYKPAIPIVYNCGGYECAETLKKLEGYVNIYLPDFKYFDNSIALKYSSAPDYCEAALNAVKEMVRQCGRPQFDGNGIMKHGVIVRHLVLPGNTKNSINVLHLLKEKFGRSILISLMAQYTPWGEKDKFPELCRKITNREYQKVFACLEELELDGFVQQRASATKDYIPDFDFTGM